MEIGLESIPINEHEIMGTLVGAVNLMFSRKLSVFSDFMNADKKKYEWVLSIANSLKLPDQHKNVKIFLAKLIDNCRNVFCHYAEFLLNPILSILTDGTFGDSLNFFVTDLVTMLLSWSHVHKPSDIEEKEDAALLLKFLMNNAYHERNEIFKLNLELIKKLIETWNEVLVGKIPTQILLDMLQKPLAESQISRLICGIQLNAVVLANNLAPWNNEEQCNLFVKAILSAFNNSSPKIHQPASQLMGLCLNMITKNNENIETATELINEKLGKLQLQRDKTEIFLQLLYGKLELLKYPKTCK
jgi:DNA-dependent protein kinase catalytic subunit